MRLTLANKISVAVIGVIALALLSSTAALMSCGQIGALMNQVVFENLPAVKAAEELEIAVLEQRGFVSSYLLDNGNARWLSELEMRKTNFHKWLRDARQTAHTPEEHKILWRLEEVYQQYTAQRDRAVKLYDLGKVAAASALLVNDVHNLYDQAYNLCESFIAANEQFTSEATGRAGR